ncbi:MAG: hypothetical protein ABI409_15440, partial [Ramlibacter sp.]
AQTAAQRCALRITLRNAQERHGLVARVEQTAKSLSRSLISSSENAQDQLTRGSYSEITVEARPRGRASTANSSLTERFQS